MKRLAIIGCGAIGAVVATAVDNGVVEAELLYLMDLDLRKAEKLASLLSTQKPTVTSNVAEIACDPRVELVVEAASQEAVLQYAKQILESGKELVVMSVGALLHPEASGLVERYWKRIHVPPGAIAGIDAIKAMTLAGLESVELVTRKHPRKLVDEPYVKNRGLRLDHLLEPVVVFEGTADEAVSAFPRTLNVAAALSLYSRTLARVKVVADPSSELNVHEIRVKSKAGTLFVRVENVPHPDNSKTSYLAALSVVKLLQELCNG